MKRICKTVIPVFMLLFVFVDIMAQDNTVPIDSNSVEVQFANPDGTMPIDLPPEYTRGTPMRYSSGGSYMTDYRSVFLNFFDESIINGMDEYRLINKYAEIHVSHGDNAAWEKQKATIRNDIRFAFNNLRYSQHLMDKLLNVKLLLTRILPTGIIVLLVCLLVFCKNKNKM